MTATSFSCAREHPRWKLLVEHTSLQGSSSTNENRATYDMQSASNKADRVHDEAQQLHHFYIGASKTETKRDIAGLGALSPLGPNHSVEENTLRNDYSQRFVDTGAGELPGNAVRNPQAHSRFVEYPKLRRLVQLKDALVTSVAHPPTYLRANLRPSLQPYRSTVRSPDEFHLGSLIPVKYDVVLIDPPLEAYEWEGRLSSAMAAAGTEPGTEPGTKPGAIPGVSTGSCWTWDEIAALPVPQVAAKESFVFLWVGSGAGDGLERGREVLSKWGYRRCEDIVCIQSNPKTSPAADTGLSQQQPPSSSAFARSSQHCLMGIRGTVRRSTDTRFVHCNVDTDVIVWSGQDELASTSEDVPKPMMDMKSKPAELYQVIENFCLGTRRLELFGRNRNLRRGWLTVGLELGPEAAGWPASGETAVPEPGLEVLGESRNEQLQAHLALLRKPREYVKAEYDSHFGVDRPGCDLRDRSNLIPFSEEIEQLRPKSPPPRGAASVGVGVAASSSDRGPATGGLQQPGAMPLGMGAGMPRGLSSHPSLRMPRGPGAGPSQPVSASAAAIGMMPLPSTVVNAGVPIPTPSAVGSNAAIAAPGAAVLGYSRPSAGLGGAGLSGLGAGGARTVSVPSGSDTLSGPQVSVLKAKAAAQAAAAAALNSAKTT